MTASKKIISRQHLEAFLESQTHAEVVEFVEALNESAVGVTLRQDCHTSEVGDHEHGLSRQTRRLALEKRNILTTLRHLLHIYTSHLASKTPCSIGKLHSPCKLSCTFWSSSKAWSSKHLPSTTRSHGSAILHSERSMSW